MDVLEQTNELLYVSSILQICCEASHLFRISSIESDASINETPFHVLVISWANVESEWCRVNELLVLRRVL